jgi:uncharacterized protein YjbI with pentapeptide repeats
MERFAGPLKRHAAYLRSLDTDSALKGAKLRIERQDIRGVDLSGRDLRWATFTGSTLDGANLKGTDLRSADLTGCSLRGADLRGAKLDLAQLPDVDLTGAKLDHTTLAEAVLRGAYLEGTSMTDADCTGVDLSASIIRSSDLDRANLSRAILDNAVVQLSTMDDAILDHASVQDATFAYSTFQHVDASTTVGALRKVVGMDPDPDPSSLWNVVAQRGVPTVVGSVITQRHLAGAMAPHPARHSTRMPYQVPLELRTDEELAEHPVTKAIDAVRDSFTHLAANLSGTPLGLEVERAVRGLEAARRQLEPILRAHSIHDLSTNTGTGSADNIIAEHVCDVLRSGRQLEELLPSVDDALSIDTAGAEEDVRHLERDLRDLVVQLAQDDINGHHPEWAHDSAWFERRQRAGENMHGTRHFDEGENFWSNRAGAYLDGIDASSAELAIGTILSSASLVVADFHNSSTPFISLRDADISGANFQSARVLGGECEHLVAQGTDFRGADLSFVRFVNADLEGADFRGARLEGTDFTSTDLHQVKFDATALDQAKFSEIQRAEIQRALSVPQSTPDLSVGARGRRRSRISAHRSYGPPAQAIPPSSSPTPSNPTIGEATIKPTKPGNPPPIGPML